MAKSKSKGELVAKSGVTVIEDERTIVTKRFNAQPVVYVDNSMEVNLIAGLPPEFDSAAMLTGFPPAAKFQNPGDYAMGEFIGMREKVGPNESRVYELSIPQEGKPSFTGIVWGSTALDRLWDSSFPPIQQGDRVAIVYLGEKETKRKQNPVKLFALKVVSMTIDANTNGH